MKSDILFAGVDVDDKAYHVAVIDSQRTEISSFSCAPSPEVLLKKLKILMKNKTLKVCYEASYTGFSLYRSLEKAGVPCDVIAPSLTPTLPGRKVKTDRLDSLQLARYYSQGLLTRVSIPTEEQEADRNVLRTRLYVLGQIKSMKNHLMGYCKRHGWDFRKETKLKSYWTLSHRTWLERKLSGIKEAHLKITLHHLWTMLIASEMTLKSIDQEILAMAQKDIYAKKVAALKCFRGLDTHSALTIITELGDINRFAHPSKLTSYVGLDIIEHSSGGKERKSGISKMGNPHVRRILVEACQYALNPSRISQHLEIRRRNANADIIQVADKCMNRLHKKGTRLLYAGKAKNKIKTACAREMLSFVWEVLKKAA